MRDEIQPRPDKTMLADPTDSSGASNAADASSSFRDVSDVPDIADSASGRPRRRIRLAHAIHSGGFYGAEKVICDLAREQSADPRYAPQLLALLDPGQAGNEVAARAAGQGLPVSLITHRPAFPGTDYAPMPPP